AQCRRSTGPTNQHGPLFTVEGEKLIFVLVVLITTQHDLELRVVVHRPLQVPEFSTVVVVVDTTRGKGTHGRDINARNVVDSRHEVYEEIAWQTRTVVFVAAP